ncbi:MAG TPA: ATP synthase F1 subunit delta [Gemmatimonadales bacterium]|nr:ATP synthase F1 subunit delta [Gemmatimonadales bacterium]
MSSDSIARNYAEALFELGEKSGQTTQFAELIDAVAGAVETTPEAQAVLMSPRVPKAEKARLLVGALRGAPKEFVLYLQALVKRGRQGLLRPIATEFHALLDIKLNRIRAGVTLARPADETLRRSIQDALGRQLGKEVIASFTVDPAILGGAVVRVGERIHDGSVRRRMTKLRRLLLAR